MDARDYLESLVQEFSLYKANSKHPVTLTGLYPGLSEDGDLRYVQLNVEVHDVASISIAFRPNQAFSEQFARLDQYIEEDVAFLASRPAPEPVKPIAVLRAQSLLSTANTEDFDDNMIILGAFIEKGDSDIANAVVELIWDVEFMERALALECLAIYGKAYFQDLIDPNVKKALDSDDECLVFSAIASYNDLSSQAQTECRPKLEALLTHSNGHIRSAAQCALD